MKSIACLTGLLLFVVAGNAAIYVANTATDEKQEEAASTPSVKPDGPLVAEPAVIDLGDLKIRESREFSVRLRNTGSRVASLTDVSAGCACTDVTAESLRLIPGGETIIRGQFRGKPDAGPFQVQLRITTSDPKQPSFSLPISGTVRTRFPLSSKEIVLSPSLADETPGTATVTVRNDSGNSIELTPTRLPEGLEATIDPTTIAPGESATMRLTAAADQVMERRIALSLGTGHPDEPSVSLPVLLRPVSSIAVTPPVLHLGVLTREEFRGHGRFELTLRTPSDIEIVEASTPAFLRAELPDEVEGDAFTISLTPAGTSLGTDLRGDIEIVCRHGKYSEPLVVRVPVSGFLKD